MSRKKRLLPESLPVIGVEREVLLPGASISLRVEDPRGMNMVEAHVWNEGNLKGKYIGLVPRESKTAQFHHIGTAASITRVTGRSNPTPHFRLVLAGLCRFRIDEFKQKHPYVVAKVTQLDYLPSEIMPSDLQPQITEFRSLSTQYLQLLHLDNPTIQRILGLLSDSELPDFLTSLLVTPSFEEKLKLLDTVELNEKFKLAQMLLHRQIATLKLHGSLQQEERKEVSRYQFPRGLGWGMPGNKKVRGQPDEDEITELEERLKAADLPGHAHKVAQKELKRLRGLPAQFPEHAVLRTYLETIVELPWATSTTDTLDLQQASLQLDKDHYGLKKVKQRVVEFLAVRKLKNSLKGPILCFVGAPGVGKTSVGRSIATTLGRKFHRISLGGISDQAEVRGHRRTYIGAIPGRIIQGLKTVGVNNPVFLLDEVDKLYRGLHGDPAAALLEVLDPEQNNSFVDHYLNIPFDLSQVLFVATANNKSDIPRPLLDRMEVIDVSGYTVEEKVEIARRHLLPRQLEQHGIGQGKLEVPVQVLHEIVSSFTAEAGVRQLERMLAAVCRSVAVKLAEEGTSRSVPIIIASDQLEDILGAPPYSHDVCERLTRPGVSVGLAWTGMGGEIMFVETSKMAGNGELLLTGQLGDVMKESAQIALNWVRSSSHKYGWACEGLDKTDIHLHFPAGAVGKDGPSAGCAIVVALVSLFSGICVRSDTAMTGEMTLRGLVLPVGGVVEKVLAAHRAGIRHVVLPRRNLKDLADISDTVKKLMKFTPVDYIEDVLQEAFDGGIPYQNVHSKL